MAEHPIQKPNSNGSGSIEERHSGKEDLQSKESDHLGSQDRVRLRAVPEGTECDSPPTEAHDKTHQIARLEAQSRRTQLMLLVAYMLLGYMIFLLTNASQPVFQRTGTVSEEIKLVNSAGTAQMFLRVHSGKPVLQLLDSQGTSRLTLGVRFDDTPFIDFSDKEGRTRGSFAMTENDEPAVKIFDENGQVSFTFN